MNDIQLRVGRNVLENWLKDQINADEVELEFQGNALRVIFRVKMLVMKMPITFTLVFERGQSNPDDPLEFKLVVNQLIRSFLKNYRGDSIKLEGDKLLVYPAKMFSIMKHLIVEDIKFEDDYATVVMRPIVSGDKIDTKR